MIGNIFLPCFHATLLEVLDGICQREMVTQTIGSNNIKMEIKEDETITS